MDFRSATQADVSLLAELNKQLIDDERHRNPMSIEQLAGRMSHWLKHEYRARIFSLADDVVGYTLFRCEPDQIYIRQFFIAPHHRRRGLGRAAVWWLRRHDWAGADRLRLDVLIANERGIAFWRALGFSDYCLTMEADGGVPATVDTLATERLIAQRLHRDAFDKLCRMHCDTKVMATLGGIQSNEQTRNWLDRNLSHWDQHGYGIWLFHTKSEAAFVGRAGLRNVHVGGNDEVELAYAVMSEFWGQGLATEMAEAILAVAFGRLGHTDVVAFTLPKNQGSRRVMEKAGFHYERDIIHSGLPHVLYRRREKTPIPDPQPDCGHRWIFG